VKGTVIVMIRIRDIFITLDEDEALLPEKCASILGISPGDILSWQIHKSSIDARKKSDIRFVYTVDISVSEESRVLKKVNSPRVAPAELYDYRVPRAVCETRPVVVGFGPAGMFSALVLAMAGLRPIVLERGLDAVSRHEKVELFWSRGELDPECNVQFGEGGAGTFSDGKLTTGTKNERIGWVLKQLVEAGAPERILYDSKPHVGTDILITVVQNIRRKIEVLGGEVRFGSRLTGFESSGGIQSAEVDGINGKYAVSCCDLILAIGHSARDTFEMLLSRTVALEPKPFSMGVRIEHLQADIDRAQYGVSAGHPKLPPADYKLACHLGDGSAYTFCMCPGGFVVAAASEEGGVVTNGMSYSDRGGKNANSALLVTLTPEDFPYADPLGGMYWQREIERAAFREGGSNYAAVSQLVGDFLQGRPSTGAEKVIPTYMPGVAYGDIRKVLPASICDTIAGAIPELSRRLGCFNDRGAVMTAPETRSSSPVRIVRGENRQSNIPGLYPCGEGAGYAGGIISAAVDGMLTAEAIIARYA